MPNLDKYITFLMASIPVEYFMTSEFWQILFYLLSAIAIFIDIIKKLKP